MSDHTEPDLGLLEGQYSGTTGETAHIPQPHPGVQIDC